MTYEPDIQQIKRDILERAISRYELRIEDLKDEIARTASVFPE